MKKNQIDNEFEETFKGKFDKIKLESDCNESEDTIEEITSSASSGSFVGPALKMKKKDIVQEITDTSSSGSYESRFFASPNKKRATGLKNYVKFWNKKGMGKAMELDFDKISKLSVSKTHEHGYPREGQLGMKALKPLKEGVLSEDSSSFKKLANRLFEFFKKSLVDVYIANDVLNILIDNSSSGKKMKENLNDVNRHLQYEDLDDKFINKVNKIIIDSMQNEEKNMKILDTEYLTEDTKKLISKIAKKRNISESLIYDMIKEDIKSMPVLYPFILNHGKQFDEYDDFVQSDCDCGSNKPMTSLDGNIEVYDDEEYETYEDGEEYDLAYGYEDEDFYQNEFEYDDDDDDYDDDGYVNYDTYTKRQIKEAFKINKLKKTYASSMGKKTKNVNIFPEEIKFEQFPMNSENKDDVFKDSDVQEFVKKMGKMNNKNNNFHKKQLLDFASQSQESIIYDVEPTETQKKYMRLDTMMRDTKKGKDLEKFGDERRKILKKQRRDKFFYS
jgi:hypothetical protein